LFFFVISYYIILEKVKTIMEGVREIMTQKVSTNLLVQKDLKRNNSRPDGGIYEQFVYLLHLGIYSNCSYMNDLNEIGD